MLMMLINVDNVDKIRNLSIVSPKLGKYFSMPKVKGNVSPTEGKQFPIVTDNNHHYLF